MVSPLSGLSLQGAPDQTLNSVLGGRQSYERSQLNQQALKQGEQEISRADYDQATQRLGVINKLATKAKSLATPQEREAFINSINPEMLKSVGIDPASIANAPRDDQGLDALIAQTSAALPQTSQYRKESVSTDQGLQVFDPVSGTYSAAKGADGKPLTSAAYDPNIAGEIARQKALATGGVELALSPEQKRREAQAQADVELATKPNIAAAVGSAEELVKNTAKQKDVTAKNKTALALYEQGTKSLRSALEGTTTGAVSGRLPAVTSGQQTAEGALAAMAPVLKSLFRESGEGTFTKDDQEILMNMLPSRSDSPSARDAKINNVDALVRIKLQGGSGQGGATPGINGNVGRFKIEVND